MKRQEMVLAYLRCSECGLLMIIPRRAARKKKVGHVKHMYCSQCKCKRAFVEEDGYYQYDPKKFINKRVEIK